MAFIRWLRLFRNGLKQNFLNSTQFARGQSHLKWVSCNKFESLGKNHFPRNVMLCGLITTLAKPDKEEDPLVKAIKLGILSMKREDFNKAERLLHLALKIAQERSDPEAVVYIHDILANVAFRKGDFVKAEKLFVDVMQRLISRGTPKDDNALVEISLKIAAIAIQRGQMEKAETGFQFCIDTQKKKVDKIANVEPAKLSELEVDTIVLWAMATDWYARFLMGRGKLEEAQARFEEALEVSKRVNGPDHHQTLVLMNDIGSVATLRKDYKSAIAYLSKAIEMGRANGTPDLSAFYCNLGTTFLKSGDHDQALKHCTEALKLANSNKQKEAEVDAKNCLDELKNSNLKFV